jgi:hypothetical protein
MKKIIRCIAAACSVGLAFTFSSSAKAQQIPAPSQQWQRIGSDQSGNNTYSIDQGTIVRQGNSVGFWTQINHRSGGISASRIYAVGECSSSWVQSLWMIQASRQGKIVTNQKSTAQAGILPPNSTGRILLDTVCGNNSPEMQAQASQAAIVQAQLEALTRARQTNADAIGNAIRTSAEMFK